MKRAVTPTTRSMFAALCAVVTSIASPGCTGSETGNPSATASLRMGLQASDPSLASVGETGQAIRVSELWLSVASIAAVSCDADAHETAIGQGAIAGELAQGVDVGQLTAGEYCGLRLLLEPAELGTLPAGVVAGAATVAVFGTRADGVPFAVLSAAPLDLAIPGAAFTVSEGASLLLAFDVSAWLRDAVLDSAVDVEGVAVLDGREPPELTPPHETQQTLSLHDDANANGQVDATEGALAGLH